MKERIKMLTRFIVAICICLFIFGAMFYFNPFDGEIDDGEEMSVITTVIDVSQDLENPDDVNDGAVVEIEAVSEESAQDDDVLKGMGIKVNKDNKIGQTINNTAQEILKQRQEFEKLVNDSK